MRRTQFNIFYIDSQSRTPHGPSTIYLAWRLTRHPDSPTQACDIEHHPDQELTYLATRDTARQPCRSFPIKRGRQTAKDHRADQGKKEKDEAQRPLYKHIPKHAATDAMSGGPAGWRETDKRRILEQNWRRSAMTANGVDMRGILTPVYSMPRLRSTLSHVSCPAAYANPMVQPPRNYSYGNILPGWTPPGREISYSPVDMGSAKGNEIERIVDSSRTSRCSSRVSTGRIQLPPVGTAGGSDLSISPAESSSGSTSSQDDLEMKPVVRHSVQAPPWASATKRDRLTSDTESIQ